MSTEYEQIVGKPNTKSKVWTHFGFPADASGTIVDKKKLVCRLCKAILAYSGNTSNLAYHLQRVHPREHRELEVRGSDDKPGPSRDATTKNTINHLCNI